MYHGKDPSGQMYRRNRFYDPSSGRFTQEDPIGIAGGLNVYGYANGDPISYREPYGLCPEEAVKGDSCRVVVGWLRQQGGAEFQSAADVLEGSGFSVFVVAGDHRRLNRGNLNRNGNPDDWRGGTTVRSERAVYLNGEFAKGDLLLVTVHEANHIARPDMNHRSSYDASAQAVSNWWGDLEWRAWNQLSSEDQAHAPRHANRFNTWWPDRQPVRHEVAEVAP